MSKLIVVADDGNFLVRDLLKKLFEYANPKILSYKDFFQNGREHPGRKFYLTPTSDLFLISRVKFFAEEKRLKLINPIDLQLFDKPRFDSIFSKHSVPYPKSILTRSSRDAMNFIRKYHFAIIKERNMCGGSGHFIVSPRWAYSGKNKYFLNLVDGGLCGKKEITEDNLYVSSPFYMQEFLIPDDCAVWRAYIVGGQVKFFATRKMDDYGKLGDYIINVAKGAKYYFPEENDVSKETRDLCNTFSASIGLGVGAIDFIFYKNKPYFLEVNCEGIWILICRKFYESPDYDPNKHDLDRFIVEHFLSKA